MLAMSGEKQRSPPAQFADNLIYVIHLRIPHL